MRVSCVFGTAQVVLLAAAAASAAAASLDVVVHFPEDELSTAWAAQPDAALADRLFGLNLYSCQDRIRTRDCPGREATFDPALWVRRTADKTGPGQWTKTLDLGDAYRGRLVLDVFAPLPLDPSINPPLLCASSVKACADSRASYEMGNEICPQIGNPWTFNASTVAAAAAAAAELHIYPAFGFGRGNTTFDFLPQFASPQFGDRRDVPVYLPPSLRQNRVRRAVNVLVLLDATGPVVDDFATRGGFETAQYTGDVPESIMVGINQLGATLAGNPNQRSLELTYGREVDPASTGSCIKAGPAHTGRADDLIAFVLEDVLPAVYAKLGMDLGEVSVAGGSLGGLFACYAASARPDVFKRAVCMSYSNCFQAQAEGFFDAVVDRNAAAHRGKGRDFLPKSVIMMFGAEVFAHNPNNGPDPSLGDDQLGHLEKDLAAWERSGLARYGWDRGMTYVGANAADVRFAYGLASGKVPANMVTAFLWTGGQHCPGSWSKYFHQSLPLAYRPQPADPMRVPFVDAAKFVGEVPGEGGAGGDGRDGGEDNRAVVVLGVLLGAAVLGLCAAGAWIAVLYRRASGGGDRAHPLLGT